MICRSCRKFVPDAERVCPTCQAIVDNDDASAGSNEDFLHAAPLRQTTNDALTSDADDVPWILVECPMCGSTCVHDCIQDVDSDDPSLLKCWICGQLWCVLCSALLKDSQSSAHMCPAWREIDRSGDFEAID